eukprot:248504_1
MNCIIRMINGVSIKGELGASKPKYQRRILAILCHIMPRNDDANPLPPYIDCLTKYHTAKSIIKLNYIELLNEYTWMHSRFVKLDSSPPRLNISNIALLFHQSEQLIFLMPDLYVLNEAECVSLLHDLRLLSNMSVVLLISFQWPSQMPFNNQANLNNHLSDLLKINWIRRFSSTSVVFECNQTDISDDAGRLFEQNVLKLVASPNASKRSDLPLQLPHITITK